MSSRKASPKAPHQASRTTSPAGTGLKIDSEGHDSTIALLKNQRQEIGRLLRNFVIPPNPHNRKDRAALAGDIIQAVKQQIWIEQEIIYPMTRESEQDQRIVNYNVVETTVLDYLASCVESMDPSHPLFDSTVEVLGEYALRHFRDQEDTLFNNQEMLQQAPVQFISDNQATSSPAVPSFS